MTDTLRALVTDLRYDLDRSYPDRAEYDIPSTVIDRLDAILGAAPADREDRIDDGQPRTAYDVGRNIVNQLADLWEVPVDVRQATNDDCWEFAAGLIEGHTSQSDQPVQPGYDAVYALLRAKQEVLPSEAALVWRAVHAFREALGIRGTDPLGTSNETATSVGSTPTTSNCTCPPAQIVGSGGDVIDQDPDPECPVDGVAVVPEVPEEAVRAGARVIAEWRAAMNHTAFDPTLRLHVLDLQEAGEVIRAALPLLGPRPLLDEKAVALAITNAIGHASVAITGVMELARPMPTREQIAEAHHRHFCLASDPDCSIVDQSDLDYADLLLDEIWPLLDGAQS